jgi:hypothetical protein
LNRVQLGAAAVVVAVLAAIFTSEAGTTPGADSCLKVPPAFVGALKSGLKAKARGKLGTPRAVKSRDSFTSGPRGLAAGVYFVSAQVRGFGIATWAADARAFKTGGGYIADVGPVARRVSVYAVDIPPSTLRSWGLSEQAHGYAQSRRCVQ